jgi:hypothetical protein
MKNNTLNHPKFQLDFKQSRRELLEKSKLSRFPELSNRRKSESTDIASTPEVTLCVICDRQLDSDDSIQQSVKVCRKFLSQYAVIDAAINEASKRKRPGMLEKFTAGLRR